MSAVLFPSLEHFLGRFRMLTIRSPVAVALVALLSLLVGDVSAVPQNRGGRKGSGKTLTPQQQAAQIPQGVSQATDGSTILDTNAVSQTSFLITTREVDAQPPSSLFDSAKDVSGATSFCKAARDS